MWKVLSKEIGVLELDLEVRIRYLKFLLLELDAEHQIEHISASLGLLAPCQHRDLNA